jgi:integrase
MLGKQAKVLSEDDLQDLLVYASTTRNPIRNRVIVLLSAKAGLRAGEIANLTWDMVVESNGAVSTAIELRDAIAKKRSGRLIPVHKDLRDALATWRGLVGAATPSGQCGVGNGVNLDLGQCRLSTTNQCLPMSFGLALLAILTRSTS